MVTLIWVERVRTGGGGRCPLSPRYAGSTGSNDYTKKKFGRQKIREFKNNIFFSHK